jgi:hypothetical protein
MSPDRLENEIRRLNITEYDLFCLKRYDPGHGMRLIGPVKVGFGILPGPPGGFSGL